MLRARPGTGVDVTQKRALTARLTRDLGTEVQPDSRTVTQRVHKGLTKKVFEASRQLSGLGGEWRGEVGTLGQPLL